MRPVGRFSMLCNPVMAPLPAADELTDNLSSERSMRQRISMGNPIGSGDMVAAG
jgi:hypothetical protein